MLIGAGTFGFRLVPCDWICLVCYLTIEDEKKEKRGRRSLRGLKEFRLLERDFGGHVYQEKLHWFLTFGFRVRRLENRCEVLVDSERDVSQ